VQTSEACFCKKDIMSMCTAPSESHQKNCRFYTKSTYNGRCMYYRFDEFCDCVDAQANLVQEKMVSTLSIHQTL